MITDAPKGMPLTPSVECFAHDNDAGTSFPETGLHQYLNTYITAINGNNVTLHDAPQVSSASLAFTPHLYIDHSVPVNAAITAAGPVTTGGNAKVILPANLNAQYFVPICQTVQIGLKCRDRRSFLKVRHRQLELRITRPSRGAGQSRGSPSPPMVPRRPGIATSRYSETRSTQWVSATTSTCRAA